MEIWKDYDCKYSVSNYGNVYNKENKKYCKLTNSNGYKSAFINNKNIRVHRLVGLLFVENKENKPFINHIDGNRTNNYYKNLEWCTHKENMQHAFRTGLCKIVNRSHAGKTNSRARKVNQYDLDGDFIKQWDYIKEASDFYNVSSISIIRACKEEWRTSCGFKWKYVDNK